MVNFNDIADTKIDDIERPPLVPIGSYICVVEKTPAQDNVGQGRFDTVDFILKVIQASEDVDLDDIKEFEKKGGSISEVRLRHRFMFNTEDEGAAKRSLYNLKRFLEDHLKVEGAASIREALATSVGHQCMVEVKWRPDQNDPEVQYPEVKRTAPVE